MRVTITPLVIEFGGSGEIVENFGDSALCGMTTGLQRCDDYRNWVLLPCNTTFGDSVWDR
jgi:hypothetical protein